MNVQDIIARRLENVAALRALGISIGPASLARFRADERAAVGR